MSGFQQPISSSDSQLKGQPVNVKNPTYPVRIVYAAYGGGEHLAAESMHDFMNYDVN